MDYKLSVIFLGVVDFFAIILPGALMTFLTLDFVRSNILAPIFPVIQGDVQGWVAFFFASYLIGHFVYLLTSFLDFIYDRTYARYQRRNGDKLYFYATELKQKALESHQDITGTLRWATAIVRLQNPVATVEIERLDADSKFFRSITGVLLIITIVLSFRTAWFVLILGLTLLSFWRYAERRWRRTQLTYTYFIALSTLPSLESQSKSRGISNTLY